MHLLQSSFLWCSREGLNAAVLQISSIGFSHWFHNAHGGCFAWQLFLELPRRRPGSRPRHQLQLMPLPMPLLKPLQMASRCPSAAGYGCHVVHAWGCLRCGAVFVCASPMRCFLTLLSLVCARCLITIRTTMAIALRAHTLVYIFVSSSALRC
jgi:hypothetical protein